MGHFNGHAGNEKGLWWFLKDSGGIKLSGMEALPQIDAALSSQSHGPYFKCPDAVVLHTVDVHNKASSNETDGLLKGMNREGGFW